jgi:hypothetical protein
MGITPDLTNTPHIVFLTAKTGVNTKTVQLPLDVQIMVNGKKIIAESKILDGVSVYERILREPYKIDFEFTVRQVLSQPGSDATLNNTARKDQKYVFPQDVLEDYIKNAWEPNSIITVENSYLNKVYGIFELVIAELPEVATVRGSNNVPMKLSCKENVDSQDYYADTLIFA